MKKNWKLVELDSASGGVFPDLEEAIEKVLLTRGIKTQKQKDAFLNPDYDLQSHDPFLMLDMNKAVSRTQKALDEKEVICVFGDYDADGVTASSCLIDFFDQLNVDVVKYIPNRNKEGYGLNKEAIDYIKSQGTNLIITVDCGISNEQEVEYASKQGIDVIVLDHHHVPPKIPNAVAVVDPKREEDAYPDKNLAGVGVAFKFIQGLASKIPEYDDAQLKWLLDLVAVGTIADCVPLVGENRMLVRYGLIVLSKTKRVGFKQLFHVGRIAINESSIPGAEMVAFQIAPRINAAGRMDHANTAQHLLLCKQTEDSKARLLALDIEEKNKNRQKVTKDTVDEAKRQYQSKKDKHNIIIATSSDWELGIVGLASGRVTDEYQRPSILLKEKDDCYKGSGRSVKGFNLVEALEERSDLLTRYGGHYKAAGLEVSKENFKEFCESIEKEADLLEDDIFIKEIRIDIGLNPKQINKELLDQQEKLEPFGEKNPKPVFVTERLLISEKRLVGNGEKHLKLTCTSKDDSTFVLDAIGFGVAEQYKDVSEGDEISLVYTLEKNVWNGSMKIQAQIKDIEVNLAPTGD